MKLILTLTLVTSCTLCFGQDDSLTVPFVSYWHKGDSYNFKVTKIKKRWKDEELTKNDSSTYIVNFEVLDSTETNYKIKWSYKTNLEQFNVPPELEDAFSAHEITEVIYTTNEVGEFIGIENWQEIAAMMKEIITKLTNALSKKDDIDKDAFDSVMQEILGIYGSKEGIEQLVFKELHYFHFPFGLEYSVNEPIEYEEELPNMLGGEPIRGDAKLYFEQVDFENSYCIMIQEMELNPEDTKQLILSFFEKMGINDDEMEELLKEAKFDISDYNRYEYYYFPGVPIKIETHRESLFDFGQEAGRQQEKTIIELIE